MSSRRVWPAGIPRALAALALALPLATCSDAVGPKGTVLGRVAVAPVLPSGAALAVFGLAIDRVRIVVVRPPPAADTLADTTAALPPDATFLELDLHVALLSSPESLDVTIEALSGTTRLFTGTSRVEVRSGGGTPTPTDIQVDTYIGPGAGVDSIAITPRSPFIYLNDTLRFQVQAFTGGVAEPLFYVAWSSGDSTVAPINGFGVLRAPAARGSVRVRARTPSGAGDSVTAVFTPPAAQLVLIAGAGQTDTVGQQLPIPLEVEAQAADGLGVGGVTVRFRSLGGAGGVTDSVVVTDAAGRARTTATLGGGIGPQSYEANAVGLAGSAVTFGAVALAGPPATLLITAGDAQLATVATSVATRPSVQLRDAGGNPVAGVGVTFAVASGSGSVTGGSQTTDATGTATIGAWTLGSAAGTNTLTASAPGLTRTFTATGVAGAAARLAFVTEPTRPLAGDTIAPLVQVAIQDQFGNTVPSAKDLVSLGLGLGGDPAAKLLGTVDVPAFNGVAVFTDVAVDSAGTGYTLLAAALNLAGAQSKPFDVGGVIAAFTGDLLRPVAAAVNPVTNVVYAPGLNNTLGVLDVGKGVLTQLPGFQAPFGVAANTQTNKIYVTTASGVVVVAGGPAPTVLRTIPLVEPRGIAVDEKTNRIYVAVTTDAVKQTYALMFIDGIEDVVVAGGSVPLPTAAAGVAFNSFDGLVYVALPALQEVAAIDPIKTLVAGEIRNLGIETYGVGVDVRSNVVYATNRGEGTVSVIDPVKLAEFARLKVGDAPEGLGVDSDRGVVYVANTGDARVPSTTVSLIDGAKFAVFATLVVGPGPKAAAVDPVTGRVFVPTLGDDQVRLIEP